MKLAYCTLGENASVLMETEEKFTYLVRCETKTSWSGFAQTPPSETTIALKAGEQVLSFRKGKSSVRFDYIELQRTGEYKAQTPSIPRDLPFMKRKADFGRIRQAARFPMSPILLMPQTDNASAVSIKRRILSPLTSRYRKRENMKCAWSTPSLRDSPTPILKCR